MAGAQASAGSPGATAGGPAAIYDLAGDIRGAVFGFFDSGTGERLACLRIGHIGRDHGHQGLFRVAWKPQVVLDRVCLEVSGQSAWPRAARQILAAFPRYRATTALVIRGFELRITAPSPLGIAARDGWLTPEGNLALSDAVVREAGSPPRRLPLALIPLTRPAAAVWSVAPPSVPTAARFHLF